MILERKAALVTGASRGVGAATALMLARAGCEVAVNYNDSVEAAGQVVDACQEAGVRAIAVQGDVAEDATCRKLVADTANAFGRLDILVNNAGISIPGTLDSYERAALDRMRRINVDGVINTIRETVEGMKSRGYGRIINIASNAAIGTALPGTTFYAATKAEVVILTRRFALELGGTGITANVVCPGWIVTDMTRGTVSEKEFAARVDEMRKRTMVGRVGAPEDIAAAVAFFASLEAGFTTAQVLTVDGGRKDYIGHG